MIYLLRDKTGRSLVARLAVLVGGVMAETALGAVDVTFNRDVDAMVEAALVAFTILVLRKKT